MPEKHDLLAAILAAKEQGIGAILAFAMAYLRGRYNGGAFTKTASTPTTRYRQKSALVRFSPLVGIRVRQNMRKPSAIGTDSIGLLINASLLKKPE